MNHHRIKIEREYFKLVKTGIKKFEIRKNDRNYKVGDTFNLIEREYGVETGNEIEDLKIRYVYKGIEYGLKEGYCIFNW